MNGKREQGGERVSKKGLRRGLMEKIWDPAWLYPHGGCVPGPNPSLTLLALLASGFTEDALPHLLGR